jgi:uncharacterized protein (TIGR02466 family)
MSTTISLFATRLRRAPLGGRDPEALRADLAQAVDMLAREDGAGRRWCRDHAYPGYTSYASLDDLPTRASAFADLRRRIDRHAAAFSDEVGFDLAGGRLKMDSLWVNVLSPGGVHTGHIHPHSVISGTYYVELPPGSSALKLEDPRLAMMMAAPTRRPDAAADLQPFVAIAPEPGEVLLWESWLRHEVVRNQAKTPRVSVSFNYSWV